MSTTDAVVVGAVLGFGFMLFAAVWVSVTGGISRRTAYVLLGAFFGVQVVLALTSGSFKSALLIFVGAAAGLAVSSIVTLPLTAVLYKRFAHRHSP